MMKFTHIFGAKSDEIYTQKVMRFTHIFGDFGQMCVNLITEFWRFLRFLACQKFDFLRKIGDEIYTHELRLEAKCV